jgi:hypothetical protein
MQQSIGRVEWPAASWLQKHGQVLLAWAIFNPNGPTLLSLGYVDNGEDRHVFLRSLSPLRETALSLAKVDADDPEHAAQISTVIHAALGTSQGSPVDGLEPFSCVPSLISLPAGDSVRAPATEWLRSALAARAFDWGREAYYLGKYGDDLFARAGEETREALEQWRRSQPDNDATRQVVEMTLARFGELPSFSDWRAAAWTHRGFDAASFDHWIETLTRDRFFSRGFFQLAQAWVGASRFLATNSSLPVVVKFDDLLAFLRRYSHPIWPLDWTEATVAALTNAASTDAGATRH